MKTLIDSQELQQVQDFWNSHLCGKQFVDAKFPSKEFFAYYREFRYKKTHHLDTYIDWKSAAGKDVLEIGLGIGADGTRWATHARSYTGVDLTSEAVYATNIHLEHLGLKGRAMQGNAEALDLPSEQFDIVYSHGVLHHTTHIDKTFREVYRVLRPGGQFIVMLYAKGSFNYWFRIQFYFRFRLLLELLKNKLGGKSKGNWALHVKNVKKDGWSYLSWKNFPHHCTDGPDCYIANIYTQRETRHMLEAAGFKIEKMKKGHFPIGGKFPKLERFLAGFMGFHQLVWARKA
ncbi:MAG: class I SAM-dependent methyltransferase [Bacteroidetes bacterium]|nr:class I SAM-dependent methyltransferase [Bacteroidota bacterium]